MSKVIALFGGGESQKDAKRYRVEWLVDTGLRKEWTLWRSTNSKWSAYISMWYWGVGQMPLHRIVDTLRDEEPVCREHKRRVPCRSCEFKKLVDDKLDEHSSRSALRDRIARGEADPISREEVELVKKIRENYNERSKHEQL